MNGNAGGITPSQLEGLRRTARIYQAGEFICLEGEPTRDLMLLLQGAIEVLQNEDVVKVIRGQQIFLGQISFFASKRRTATLRAKTRCEIVLIREERIEQLLAAMPSLSLRLIRDITEMFIKKEGELGRYRSYGTQAHQAMNAAELESIMQGYLPPLLASLMHDVPEVSRLTLAMGLIDALSKHINVKDIVMNRVAMPPEMKRADVRQSIDSVFLQLLQEKSRSATAVESRGDLSDSDELFHHIQRLETVLVGMSEQRLTVGAENELRGLRREINDLPGLLREWQIGRAVDALERCSVHVGKMQSFASLQRASDQYRNTVTDAEACLEALHVSVAAIADVDREGTLRRQILDYLKFEI